MSISKHKFFFPFLLLALSFSNALAATAPFSITTGLFNLSNTVNLGLGKASGSETVSVFKPSDNTDHFSNGVVMIAFKNKLYCMWQSSATSEDTPDTEVMYSISEDGKSWSAPIAFAATISNGYISSGGWWATADTLVAYINTWPTGLSPKGGYTRCMTSTNGLNWSAPQPVLMATGETLNGIFEQDPHRLPDGRLINAAHFQPGLNIAPIYTDDPTGIRGWKKGNYTCLSTGNSSREMEPSNFLQSDGKLVMIFRDQNSTMVKLASVSTDRGVNWSTSVVTNMPDSRSKQSAGNLPDGTAFFASNPTNWTKPRTPLALTLSKDGILFDKAYVLREDGADLQAQRYTGTSKGLGYSYPKSLVYGNYLYVSYSTNKEDVEFTRVPLASISLNTGIRTTAQTGRMQISLGSDKTVSVTELSGEGQLQLFNLAGKSLLNRTIQGTSVKLDLSNYPAGLYLIRTSSSKGVETGKFILR